MTLLLVLIFLNGLLTLAGGILLVLVRSNDDVLRDTGESSDTLLTLGIVVSVIGLIYLAVARGLATGNGLARFLVGLNSAITLVGGLYLAVAQEGQLVVQGLVSAGLALIVLLLLYSPRANEFFRTN